MMWAYGITTTPVRRYKELPQTIKSLASAGFNEPRLFIDGIHGDTTSLDYSRFNLPLTFRSAVIGAMGNWALGMYELYIRAPAADFFVMFEDDLLACDNLKAYLSQCQHLKENAYCNLLTHDCNAARRPHEHNGWYLSDQRGKGAVGLAFSNATVCKLLSSKLFVERFRHPIGKRLATDGAICDALVPSGFKEYVHYPSLLQHTGIESTLKGHKYGPVKSFNETFDPINLLKKE